jgi:thiol-disulfide isomerase/thioredoxin
MGRAAAKIARMKYALAFLLIILACAPSLLGASPGEVSIGENLRQTPMQGLTGDSALFSRYRGKPLIINVWASYCGPCLAEMGSLERLWQRYGDRINIIGISIDDYRERAEVFLARAGTTFPHYIDNKLILENMLGVNNIPLTVLVDKQGRVLEKVSGAKEWDSPELVEAIGQAFDISVAVTTPGIQDDQHLSELKGN